MAKGQMRGNKEAKKPKKKKEEPALATASGNKDAPLSIGSMRKPTKK